MLRLEQTGSEDVWTPHQISQESSFQQRAAINNLISEAKIFGYLLISLTSPRILELVELSILSCWTPPPGSLGPGPGLAFHPGLLRWEALGCRVRGRGGGGAEPGGAAGEGARLPQLGG